jgi:hypothetical protein
MLAAELRNYDLPFSLEEEDTSPSFEPIEEDDGEKTGLDEASTSTSTSKTDRSIPAPPTRVRDPKAAIRALAGAVESLRLAPTTPEVRKYKSQRAIISAWINDPDQSAVTEDCRHVLELYAQLTESEFSYVLDLQTIYDETRCFFLQWILGKVIKEFPPSKWETNLPGFTHVKKSCVRSRTSRSWHVSLPSLAYADKQGRRLNYGSPKCILGKAC